MENERIFIAMDRQSFLDVLNEIMDQRFETNKPPKFEDDRLSKPATAKLAQISLPTLDRLIKAGRFKQYNTGHRKYFLKSEVLESLRNNG